MTHPSPHEAATDGIPPGQVQILDTSISPDGLHAVVLLAVGEAPTEWIFEALCRLGGEGWEYHDFEYSCGWSFILERDPLGVETSWTTETARFDSVEWDAPEPPPPAYGKPGPLRW